MLFLLSFDNLVLFHITGTSNFLSDSFIPMFARQLVEMSASVTKAVLERFGPTQLPENSVINPEALPYLLKQPPNRSQYESTHIRKKFVCTISLAAEIVDNLNSYTTEEKVIMAALLGYDPQMMNDFYWDIEAQKGGMTEKNFKDYSRKYKLEAIRDNLQVLCAWLSHQIEGTPLNVRKWSSFFHTLRDLASDHIPSSDTQDLADLCICLHDVALEPLLDKIIVTYAQSSLYVHSATIKDLYTVIPSSNLHVINRNSKMNLAPNHTVRLHPAQVHTFWANMKILLDLHVTCLCLLHYFPSGIIIQQVSVSRRAVRHH